MLLALVLPLQGTSSSSTGAKPSTEQQAAKEPDYPYDIEPQDALWGHLELGNFREPIGVFYEPKAGELYVADSKNGLIGIFDSEGTPQFAFGGAPMVAEPTSVLALADGTIHVVDSTRREVQTFNYRGEPREPLRFLRPTDEPGVEPSELVTPRAVARDDEGHWFVVDGGTQRCFMYDKDCKYAREIGPPLGKDHFDVLADVAVSKTGLVALVDQRGTPALYVFDSAGKFIAAFGGRDIGLDNFTSPIAASFDDQGFLYAVDLLRHDVKVFTASGRFVQRFGGWFSPETRGRAPGEMLYPADITIAPAGGPIYVAERFGQRVQVFVRKPKPPPPPPRKRS